MITRFTSCWIDDPDQAGQPSLPHFSVFALPLALGQFGRQRLNGVLFVGVIRRFSSQRRTGICRKRVVKDAGTDHGTTVFSLPASQVNASRAPDLHARLLILQRSTIDGHWNADRRGRHGRSFRRRDRRCSHRSWSRSGRYRLTWWQWPAVGLKSAILATDVGLDSRRIRPLATQNVVLASRPGRVVG